MIVVGKKYPIKYSGITKLGCIFSDKLLSFYDIDESMRRDGAFQRKPLKSLKIIEALFGN